MPTNNEAATAAAASPAKDMAALMAAQSAAMLLEDLRSFVQGGEQILLVALAKALEKGLSQPAEAGYTVATVDSITGALSSLSKYAESITNSANHMAQGLHCPDKVPVPAPDVQVRAEVADTEQAPTPEVSPSKNRGFFANLMF